MTTIVIFDPERGMAVLVDDEAGVALGPVLQGDGAEVAMSTFLESLPFDPAGLKPWSIDAMWRDFLEVVNASDEDAAAGVVRGDADGSQAPVARGRSGSPASDPPAAQAGAGGVVQSASGGIELLAQTCFMCEGTGRIMWGEPPAEIECPTCHGTGQTARAE